MDDKTQRYFDDEIPETQIAEGDLSASSDALSISFAKIDNAEDYQSMAHELRLAARHCEEAAARVLADDLNAGSSHGLAARGHIQKVLGMYEALSMRHAKHLEFEEE